MATKKETTVAAPENEEAVVKEMTAEEKEKAEIQKRLDWRKKVNAEMNERVTFHTSKSVHERGDIILGRNGVVTVIKRGEDVSIPRGVALIFQRSQEQDTQTADMIEATEGKDIKLATF